MELWDFVRFEVPTRISYPLIDDDEMKVESWFSAFFKQRLPTIYQFNYPKLGFEFLIHFRL